VIAFDRIVARYPRATNAAVDGVSFAAAPGALTAVVGPNGSGKSTLVRAILGRVPLVAGDITHDGRSLTTITRREVAKRVAVVVQREEPAFPMRVLDYLALGRHPVRASWSRSSGADPVVAAVIEEAGVGLLADRSTDQLSGGEWQRVRIARALAQATPIIVMDEPTTALDIGHEMESFELLESLAARGKTVLVVSHQLNLVARFADHVVLLHRGRVVAAGSAADVMNTAVLEPVYEWPLGIIRDQTYATTTLIPLRRTDRSTPDTP
jgi:iron complex transport system ATP-binding protein